MNPLLGGGPDPPAEEAIFGRLLTMRLFVEIL